MKLFMLISNSLLRKSESGWGVSNANITILCFFNLKPLSLVLVWRTWFLRVLGLTVVMVGPAGLTPSSVSWSNVRSLLTLVHLMAWCCLWLSWFDSCNCPCQWYLTVVVGFDLVGGLSGGAVSLWSPLLPWSLRTAQTGPATWLSSEF